MTGGADENAGYVTLQTLVETAKNKLVSQQQQQQNWVPVQLLSCSHVVVQLPCVVFLRSVYWITYINKHCGFVL